MANDGYDDSERAEISRRKFVVAAAAALGVCTRNRAAAADPPVPRRDYDVIVIGGGFCGVTAARECQRAGLRTLIVEARNRLGGRTNTVEFEGSPTDLGGTWVHWAQPHVWSEIRRAGLELGETNGTKSSRWILHSSKHDVITMSYARVRPQFERAFNAFMGDSRQLVPLPYEPFGSDAYRGVESISSWERLESLKGLSAMDRDMVDSFAAGLGSNYSDQFAWLEMVRCFALAGHNLADCSDSIGRFHFKAGTVALISAIQGETRPEIRLNSPVRQVIHDGSGASVVTKDGGEFRSRAVISTIPLNVLKDIEWQPGLSAVQLAASRKGHAGIGTKFYALVEGDYGNVGCLAPSHIAVNSLSTERVEGGNTLLVGFGPRAELLDVTDRGAVQSAVNLFLPDAKVIKHLGYDWTNDPYSRGTWCNLRPGMWSDLRELQQTRGRVIFASADWANGWRGFIDGAIEQGLEAGKRAKAMLV